MYKKEVLAYIDIVINENTNFKNSVKELNGKLKTINNNIEKLYK